MSELTTLPDVQDGFRLYFFDNNETLLATRSDIQSFVVEEGEYCLTGSVPIDNAQITPKTGLLVAFYDRDSNFVLYEIKRYTPMEPQHTIEFYAEHAAMCELLDEVVLGKAVTNGSAGYAVQKVLENTRWQMDSDSSSGTASTTFYYKSAWECLNTIAKLWNCAFSFRWEFNGLSIAHRYITILARLGADRGKRFELWKDINNASITYDDSNVCTLCYGRGKGEEVGANADGAPTYGRRITFADVVWSVNDGDPVDKPLNQEYVENTAATALYGRCGRPRKKVVTFESVTDPEELLDLTWDYLSRNSAPLFDASLGVIDLEEVYGFDYEAVRVGDGVLAIVDEAGVELQAVIKNISRDYIQPEQTRIHMGNFFTKTTDIQAELMERTRKALEQAAIGADAIKANESLLHGIIDTMTTMIMSSGTNFTTDQTDGSFLWVSNDGTKAVKITGSGILISNHKEAGAWVWSTALDGSGMAANIITTGTLQATLVKILGSNMFYWDAANIHIFDPSNTDNEIRIGQYDGTHYGVAFTRDGGLTWASAIDFNGAHVSSQEQYSAITATNYSLMFTANSDGTVPEQIVVVTKIGAMTGTTVVTPVVSSVTGMPTGMTASIGAADANHQVPITITVAANSNLGSSGNTQGQLVVHATSPVSQDVILNWAKVKNGENATGTRTYFCGANAPEIDPQQNDLHDGDLWINSDNNNKMYRWNGTTVNWVSVSDMTIDDLQASLIQAEAYLDIVNGRVQAIAGETYATQEDLKSTITTIRNQIIAQSDSLRVIFNRTVSDADGALRSDISALIRASGDGVEIGRSDSNFKTRLTNDRLSFIEVQNNSEMEVAYISNRTLFITDAQVTSQLAMGVGNNNLFKWKRVQNGLALIYQS